MNKEAADNYRRRWLHHEIQYLEDELDKDQGTLAANRIYKGLIASGMKPFVAMVLMYLFTQFPEILRRNRLHRGVTVEDGFTDDDFWFIPNERIILETLGIKEDGDKKRFHDVVGLLVKEGYLLRRPAKNLQASEYRIVFDKLQRFVGDNGK